MVKKTTGYRIYFCFCIPGARHLNVKKIPVNRFAATEKVIKFEIFRNKFSDHNTYACVYVIFSGDE